MTHRILVADDSSSIQKVIRIAFSRYQVKIETASQFVEAVSSIHMAKPELILADASLPGIQSVKDFRRLVQEAGQVPIILLRGSYDDIDEESLRLEGFDAIIKKPFESQDIVRAVQRVLGFEFQRKAAATAAGTPSVTQPTTPPRPPVNKPTIATLPDLAGDTYRGFPEPPVEVGLTRNTMVQREPIIDFDSPEQEGWRDQKAEVFDGLIGQEIMDDKRKGERAFAATAGQRQRQHASEAPVQRQTASEAPVQRQHASDNREAPAQRHTAADSHEPIERYGFGSSIPGYEQPKPAKVKSILEPMLRDELAQMVRETVEEYCARHFNQLAREIITKEIRRLAEEKTRHLVDT